MARLALKTVFNSAPIVIAVALQSWMVSMLAYQSATLPLPQAAPTSLAIGLSIMYGILSFITAIAAYATMKWINSWPWEFKAWFSTAAVFVAMCPQADAADCRQFFRQSYSYVAPVYAAQVVAYPQVYYQAGRDIEAEALAEKVARLVDKKLELRQQQRQQVATRPQSMMAQHCAKCHSGATPKAGLVYDGVTGMDARLVTAALKQIKDGSMPKDHPIPSEVKAALMDELLNLEAEPVPPVVPRDVGNDLPKPPPDDGGLR